MDKNCARTTLGDAYNDWQFDQLAVDGVITREHLKAAIRGEPIVSVTETTKIGVSSASSAAAAAAITSADTVGTASTGETNSTKKSTKKSGKQYSLLVCLSESSGPVCKCVADATAGMRFSKSHADCNKRNSVWFLAGGMELQRALDAALPGKQSPVLSKFPGAREACNKAVMSAQLNWAQYLFPETFDFWPISYNLPGNGAIATYAKESCILYRCNRVGLDKCMPCSTARPTLGGYEEDTRINVHREATGCGARRRHFLGSGVSSLVA